MRKKTFLNVFIYICMTMALNGLNSISIKAQTASSDFLIQSNQSEIYFSLDEALPETSEPVLLVFFSLTCHICWDELIEMKEFIEKCHIPVQLIGISLDAPDELRAFSFRYSFYYPIIHDKNKELYRRFQVKLEPYRVILDNDRLIYADDYSIGFNIRREKVKQCLLAIASK